GRRRAGRAAGDRRAGIDRRGAERGRGERDGTGGIDGDHRAGAAGRCGAGLRGEITGEDVAVVAGREAGVECASQRAGLAVDGDESEVAATKGDLAIPVVPPVRGEPAGRGRVAECDHVADRAEAVLAYPAADRLVEAGR